MNSSFDKDHETMSCCVFLLRAEIESPSNRCPEGSTACEQTSDLFASKDHWACLPLSSYIC